MCLCMDSVFCLFLVLFSALGKEDPDYSSRRNDANSDPHTGRNAGGRKNGDSLRFGLAAVLAGEHLLAGLLLRRLGRHLAVVPLVAERLDRFGLGLLAALVGAGKTGNRVKTMISARKIDKTFFNECDLPLFGIRRIFF